MDNSTLTKVVNSSGKNEETILAELDMLKKEYGISEKTYLKREYYAMPEEEMIAAADKLRKNRRYVKKVCDATGWTRTEAKEKIRAARSKLGISTRTYLKDGYYDIPEEEQEACHKQKNETKEEPIEKTDWTAAIAEEASVDVDAAKELVRKARKDFGVTAALYYKMGLWNMSRSAQATELRKRDRRLVRTDERYDLICGISGRDGTKIKEDLQQLREKFPDEPVSFIWYFKNGIYDLDADKDADEIKNRLDKAVKRQEIRDAIKEKIVGYYSGKINISDIEPDIEEYRQAIKEDLSKARRLELWEKAKDSVNEERFDEVTLDMEVMYMTFGFTPTEYVMFHFWEKDMEERATFLSNELKGEKLSQMNAPSVKELFDSKYDAYQALKPLYGREIALIDRDHGYETFSDFVKRHEVFVKKSNFDAMGHGIKKIDVKKMLEEEKIPVRDLYDDLREEEGVFVLEELIEPYKTIKELNPDSVNTVRIVTGKTSSGVTIEDCFMKVGRKGSFVDNGGAGGIIIHIDSDKGALDSDGIDERGIRYSSHPDHGYTFRGIKMPKWKKALKKAVEAAGMIDGANYIGWDLTFTSDKEWIIVEGNGATQFIGQQATIDKGMRERFTAGVEEK